MSQQNAGGGGSFHPSKAALREEYRRQGFIEANEGPITPGYRTVGYDGLRSLGLYPHPTGCVLVVGLLPTSRDPDFLASLEKSAPTRVSLREVFLIFRLWMFSTQARAKRALRSRLRRTAGQRLQSQ